MSRSPATPARPRVPSPPCRTRVAVAALLLTALALFAPAASPAGAGEPGGSTEAAQVVRQAIALIVNTPGDRMGIEDRLSDALRAPKRAGVDLGLVRRAQAALATGNVHEARRLLERSIGARPHLGRTDPQPIREVSGEPLATGAEAGTNVVADPLPPDRSRSGGDWLALAGLAALGGLGLWLAARFRPTTHGTEEVRP
ncbi:MAG: hypothetical protein HYX34_00175 [Actinobacteria bacterium]|nr:hypothetical protein [Actinomycetota bacterium]